jgi:hypothetical protein
MCRMKTKGQTSVGTKGLARTRGWTKTSERADVDGEGAGSGERARQGPSRESEEGGGEARAGTVGLNI